jgi:amidase
MSVECKDPSYLEITELADLIRKRKISSFETTKLQLARIAAIDAAIHSYVTVLADDALARAAQADDELAAGIDRGPLHGVPIGVKDLFWTKGHPTTAGTAIYRSFVPNEDATVVTRLRNAGAVIIGKLQLTEGAYSDHHPSVQPPRNPWNSDYWPGISSSGTGTALAAGLCYGAIATDTGGSIRWPSAANGVTGLKPTWGRVSRYGAFELAATLDHVGAMARSATDVGIILAAIAGEDPKDPTTFNTLTGNGTAGGASCVEGLRIGVDLKWNEDDVDGETRGVLRHATEVLISLGAKIVAIELPDPSAMVQDWAPNCAVEAAVAHEASYSVQREQYGPVLASVIDAGSALSGTEYQKIILRRMDFVGRLKHAMQGVDLLLVPVQPFPPLTLEAVKTLGDQPHLIAQLQRYTCPFNMTGNPTITLPGGFTSNGMPIGFQLVANHLKEDMLITVGAAFQRVTNWHHRHPVLP